MKELVELLAKSIVDNPKAVSVEEATGEAGEILTLSVESTDMGKVIGKGGKVIKALRTLLRIKAIKENRRVYLKLLDENNPQENSDAKTF